jgi:hypothetical protein
MESFEITLYLNKEKVIGVVTDNPNVMQKAWKLIQERFPKISAYGCAAYAYNLLMKDILELPEFTATLKESSKIVSYVNNHHMILAAFEEERKHAGSGRKLCTSVPTRWSSEFNSISSILDSKVILKRLVSEDRGKAAMATVATKTTTEKFIKNIKDDKLWDRLQKLHSALELPAKMLSKF